MRIANTAALILAMTPFLAVAQRSGGRLDRKPSPATSAASAPSGPVWRSSRSGNTHQLKYKTKFRSSPYPACASAAGHAARQQLSRPEPHGISGGCALLKLQLQRLLPQPAVSAPLQRLNQQPAFITRKDN